MDDAPRFHQTGDPGGHFFALAFSRGRYVSPSGTVNTPATFVLYFSNSVDFAPFSFMTVSSEGEQLAYQRGDEVVRTVEHAILSGLESAVPVATWTLYPRADVDDDTFPDEPTREAYWESRRRLCVMLYRARVVASVVAQLGRIEPTFRPDGAARLLDDREPDNAEIWETVVELLPDSPSGSGPS